MFSHFTKFLMVMTFCSSGSVFAQNWSQINEDILNRNFKRNTTNQGCYVRDNLKHYKILKKIYKSNNLNEALQYDSISDFISKSLILKKKLLDQRSDSIELNELFTGIELYSPELNNDHINRGQTKIRLLEHGRVNLQKRESVSNNGLCHWVDVDQSNYRWEVSLSNSGKTILLKFRNNENLTKTMELFVGNNNDFGYNKIQPRSLYNSVPYFYQNESDRDFFFSRTFYVLDLDP